MATTITSKKNSSLRSDLLPWLIWGLAALFYAYEFFLQVSVSVMGSDLMRAFSINAAQLGNLAGLYFYAYAPMQIPAGIFLDTFGPRKLLTTSSAVCVLGALLFGIGQHLWQAEIGRLLIGVGSAFAVIGAFKLAAEWFTPNRFAFVVGLTVMLGMLGAVVGGAPLALVVNAIGWRESMLCLAGFGLLLCFLIWFVVRDTPNTIPTIHDTANPYQKSIGASLRYIFKQKQNWLLGLYGGLMFAPTSAFAALWGVPFLMTKYAMSKPAAAGAISLIFIGWAVASPLWGWFSDQIHLRKPPMYIGTIVAFITMMLIIYVSLPITLLYISLFCFGFFSAGFLPSFSMVREISPPEINATALGFMNMMNMIGGAFLQPMIGWILDKYWQGQLIHGARIFPLHAFYSSLFTLPCILFLAFLLMPFIRETHCQSAIPKS